MPRFENLKRTAERVDSGSLKPSTKKEAAEPAVTAKSGSLKDKLGARKPSSATVRMSVEMSTEMHAQVTAIAQRAGVPKVEVVRQILEETLPELL